MIFTIWNKQAIKNIKYQYLHRITSEGWELGADGKSTVVGSLRFTVKKRKETSYILRNIKRIKV